MPWTTTCRRWTPLWAASAPGCEPSVRQRRPQALCWATGTHSPTDPCADSHTIQTAMALCSENWRAERSRAGASSNPATGQRNTRSRPRSSRQAAPTGQAGLSTAAGLASPALTLDARLDAPVNPYEPTYCTCGQVAFGEMIACDAEDCSVEWFHCACVGIAPSNRPKDKWYCPTCAPRVAASGGAGGVQPALGYSGSASAASPTAGGGHSGSLASPTSTQADVFIPGLGHLSAFAHGRGSDVAGAVLAGSTGAVPASLVPSGPEAPRPLKRPRATTSPTHSPASVLSQVLADAQGVDTSWSVRRVADEASQAPSARLRRAVARRRRQAAQAQSSDAGSSDSASEAGSLTDSDSASASSSVSEPSPPLTRSQRRKAPRYV